MAWNLLSLQKQISGLAKPIKRFAPCRGTKGHIGVSKAPKSKSKAKLTDAERHKRFVAMGEEVGASKDPKDFEKAFKSVAPSGPSRKTLAR